MPADIGIIGMGVMGRALALNFESHGFQVAVYNRTTKVMEEFVAAHPNRRLTGCITLEELTQHLKRPRITLMMVKAGPAVDAVLDKLLPLLEEGDVVMDGGNSFFRDTERRAEEAAKRGIGYIGLGISGGEEGALRGPSLMAGGDHHAYKKAQPLLEAIAARAPKDGKPCTGYFGPGGAGHYVKMVHNGIEYAIMQLIAETYDIMRRGMGLPLEEIRQTFAHWSEGEMGSFLVEITAHILGVTDDETGRPLIALILDRAGQKGTGRWTAQEALELGVPTPTLTSAVEARSLSARKEERVSLAQAFPIKPAGQTPPLSVETLGSALFAAQICAYIQGLTLLQAASQEYGYGMNLADVVRVWRAGCIIRARVLEKLAQALDENPNALELLTAEGLKHTLEQGEPALRQTVQAATGWAIPAPGFSSTLAWLDAYRTERLPANLIQAQRDYFGAHTFERIDRPGSFHHHWK